MTVAPFPTDPVLTGITIAYRNASYIADDVLPRVPVSKQEFKYWLYPVEETFRLPDTKVGRRSQPNEIDLTASETPAATEDYGLEDPIPQADIDNAPANHNPRDRSSVQLTDYIQLDREKRTADLVFAAATYPAGNKVTLAGVSQWSDPASTPIADIMAGLDACLIRPNIAVFGQAVWTKLRQHASIIQAVNMVGGTTAGVASRRAVADLLELEDILVGQSRLNTAKKGQAATLSRIWGKHASLMFRDRNADTRSGLTFGFTAQWGSRIAGSMTDPKIGLRGGERVRVGESVKELIVAGQAGFFIENAVA